MPVFSTDHPIAFFCAEFGFDSRLPLYAGGLGILAGDILKTAADMQLPMVGVGLLYRGCMARQKITPDGMQEDEEVAFDPLSCGLEHVYVDDMPLFIRVHLTELDVWVRVWKKQFGPTVTLYLLDTDTDQNHVSERDINACLYSGAEEALMKQQLILGIGGVKLLHSLNIHPALYHINEGRPAFLHWQLIRSYMSGHGLSFEMAREAAIQKTVYTNHTLLGAATPSHNLDLLKTYSRYYAEKMGLSVDQLLERGLDEHGKFNITLFALRTSRKASAVSQLHLRFCQQQWPQHNWVGITNAVHLPTWQSQEMHVLQQQPAALWHQHLEHKKQLAQFVQQRSGYSFDPNRLVMTWSRRITAYKQMNMLFSDLERLKKLVSQSGREVQILLAGKAHAYDTAAKGVLQQVISYFQNELSGYALFVPDYNIELAQHLVKGSDIWLNTPEYGLEASGTSGMKAASNGVLNVTVPDGWAAEVGWDDKGWSLDANNLPEDLYQTLEKEVVPLYYERDEQGVPFGWVAKMQRSMSLARQYGGERMMREYVEKLYS